LLPPKVKGLGYYWGAELMKNGTNNVQRIMARLNLVQIKGLTAIVHFE
jgi:hypothetical protein